MTGPTNQPQKNNTIADAVAGNWVDHHAPIWSRDYLRLMRLDRPIGIWLLLLPCWWSLALASGVKGQALDLYMALLFLIGATVMRGAGCTYNDILDRDIDAQVKRTKNRPLASGRVSLKAAWIFLIAQCLIGLVVLLQFNQFTIVLGTASLILVAVYPMMKRFTYWPQAFLGLAFNWGALVGWTSVTGALDPAPLALYLAGISWTIGYDTIYAHQDREDDAMLGLKSTALKFGEKTRGFLALFYGMTFSGILAAGYFADLSSLTLAGLTLACLHLAWQIWKLDIHDPALCLRLFKSNRLFGVLILIVFLSDIAL